MSMRGTGLYVPGFTQLSPTALYHVPSQHARPSRRCITSEPRLILVTSWLDAAPRHVAKYIVGIQKIFPTSRILLITTTSFHFLFQPTTQRLRELQPAVNILKDTPPCEKILLYCFSNGGSTAAFMIARAFRAQTKQSLPLSKAIFDSAPGNGGYLATVRAFAVGLPRARFVRALGLALLRVFLALWYLAETITATENVTDIMRRGLNDRLLFTTNAARLYFYSTNDSMVPWQDVEAHASSASSAGYKVHTVRYVGSSHVGHIMQDEARYWAAVEQLWNSDYLSAPGLVTVAW